MPLQYHPHPGDILLCDFGTGFVAPEMVKRRPVIIVSPRLRRRAGLVAVVPLSTTPPETIEDYHCRIVLARQLPQPFEGPEMWAKCDMLATVALSRIDRFKAGRVAGSHARKFVDGKISAEQLLEVRRAILCGLGMPQLTVHV